jgi:hypothetical protein
MLAMLFQQYPSFHEVGVVSPQVMFLDTLLWVGCACVGGLVGGALALRRPQVLLFTCWLVLVIELPLLLLLPLLCRCAWWMPALALRSLSLTAT